LTALAAGHVTITAGTAAADVTVTGDALALGAVLYRERALERGGELHAQDRPRRRRRHRHRRAGRRSFSIRTEYTTGQMASLPIQSWAVELYLSGIGGLSEVVEPKNRWASSFAAMLEGILLGTLPLFLFSRGMRRTSTAHDPVPAGTDFGFWVISSLLLAIALRRRGA
jgi:hypothetical protein